MNTNPDLVSRILSMVFDASGTLLAAGIGAGIHALYVRWHKRPSGIRAILERLDAIDKALERQEAEYSSIKEAQHVAMRQQLSHNAEKYLRRTWLTSEERQSWWEMYVAYGSMGKNGYMAAYWERLENLPIKALDEIIGQREDD